MIREDTEPVRIGRDNNLTRPAPLVELNFASGGSFLEVMHTLFDF